MKVLYSRERFPCLWYWQRRILLYFFLPDSYQPPITAEPLFFSLTLEHLFYYNPPHVYLAQVIVPDRLASRIRPSHIPGQ